MEIAHHFLSESEAENINSRIYHDRVALLHQHLLATSLPATLLCATVLFFGFYNQVNNVLLVIWYICVLLVLALRIGMYFYYQRHPNDDTKNLWLFIAGSTLGAFMWSVAGTVLMPAHNMSLVTLGVLVIAGVTAGGSQTLQPSRIANMLFMVLSILPLTGWLLMRGEYSYIMLSIAVFGYLFFMLVLAQRGYAQLIDSLQLRYLNEVLVTRLSTTNTTLMMEISERKKTQEQLDYIATHDVLTRIPNRFSFNMLFTQTIARATRSKKPFSILFIDIDHFKLINDNYGHDVGDALLCQVAKRLTKNLRANDTIARIGGDEFIILLEDAAGNDFLQTFSQRMTGLFSKPIRVHDHNLYITISVGISFFPDDGDTINTLLKKADIALYRAKESGRNRMEIYNEVPA